MISGIIVILILVIIYKSVSDWVDPTIDVYIENNYQTIKERQELEDLYAEIDAEYALKQAKLEKEKTNFLKDTDINV